MCGLGGWQRKKKLSSWRNRSYQPYMFRQSREQANPSAWKPAGINLGSTSSWRKCIPGTWYVWRTCLRQTFRQRGKQWPIELNKSLMSIIYVSTKTWTGRCQLGRFTESTCHQLEAIALCQPYGSTKRWTDWSVSLEFSRMKSITLKKSRMSNIRLGKTANKCTPRTAVWACHGEGGRLLLVASAKPWNRYLDKLHLWRTRYLVHNICTQLCAQWQQLATFGTSVYITDQAASGQQNSSSSSSFSY